MVNALSILVGEELKGRHYEWFGSVSAPNGSIYAIPSSARRVMKFDPGSKSITNIGPDFGDGEKWMRGAMTHSGVIYSTHCNRGILKIDTNTDNVI